MLDADECSVTRVWIQMATTCPQPSHQPKTTSTAMLFSVRQASVCRCIEATRSGQSRTALWKKQTTGETCFVMTRGYRTCQQTSGYTFPKEPSRRCQRKHGGFLIGGHGSEAVLTYMIGDCASKSRQSSVLRGGRGATRLVTLSSFGRNCSVAH